MKILVSACLLGLSCRYDGQAKPCEKVIALKNKHVLIPVCPEQLGGLSTPRAPSEIRGKRVASAQGGDNTSAFLSGAAQTCRLAALFSCKAAILKSNSPSCGIGHVYDGTFTGVLTEGDGVTAAALKSAGLTVMNEDDPAIDAL